MNGALTQYERMRAEVQTCARIDEAAKLRDKAEALRAYARQQKDKDLQGWMDDIKVRAIARMGELTEALPRAAPGGAVNGKKGGSRSLGIGTSKESALKAAGVTTQQASEAERVAKVVREQGSKRLKLHDVRQIIKRERRTARESELAEKTKLASTKLGKTLYSVIYADPPWRFEPYSRDTGMDRAADNHYQTMDLDALKAFRVPAADDCVLFLWATVPMLPEALAVMAAWGFTYKSQFVWVKDKAGTGYWNRNRHELLLIGTRGKVPAPAPGEQYDSVITVKQGRHSEKPEAFAEIIDDMFPNLSGIELFARRPRVGWDTWGNET